jgi:uncharacterized membrane protein
MTTKTLHERSVHIDAPVDKVFDYMKDPRHFLEMFPEKDRKDMAITEVSLTHVHARRDRHHAVAGLRLVQQGTPGW